VNEDLDFLVTAETHKKAYIMLYLVKLEDGQMHGVAKHASDLNYLDLSESFNSNFYYMGV
jgi:hypothetical protein